jgi:hypothetical protein
MFDGRCKRSGAQGLDREGRSSGLNLARSVVGLPWCTSFKYFTEVVFCSSLICEGLITNPRKSTPMAQPI